MPLLRPEHTAGCLAPAGRRRSLWMAVLQEVARANPRGLSQRVLHTNGDA